MTAVAVELCACSHAERMHERDTETEHGRGACAQGSCGCSEYRPRTVDVPPPAPAPGPVATPDPSPAPEPSPGVSEVQVHACPDCGKEFSSGKGVGGHRAKAHPGAKKATAAAPVRPATPEPEPAAQPAPEPAVTDPGDKPDLDVGVPPAGTDARYSLTAHIGLGSGGYIELDVTHADRAELDAFLDLISSHLTTTGRTPA